MSDNTRSGPDGMTTAELAAAGGQDYAYLDQTRQPHVPLGGQGDGISSAILNPAYYPAATKPTELHGEAEKAGGEFPTGQLDKEPEGRDAGRVTAGSTRKTEVKNQTR